MNIFRKSRTDERLEYLEGRVKYLESAIKELRDENVLRIGKLEDTISYRNYPYDPRPTIAVKDVVRMLLEHLGVSLHREHEIPAKTSLVKEVRNEH